MASTEPFLDTNVLVYLISGEVEKAERSGTLVKAGGLLSVQVLNEFARVGLRKLSLPFGEVRRVLETVRMTCRVIPLTLEMHDMALDLAQHHQLHIYDAMIVASAVLGGCTTLYTEDMHDGLVIDGLTIRNPY